MEPSEQAVAYWREFCARTGVDPGARYDVWSFGDSPAMADELAGLVLTGPKRATAGLLGAYEQAGDPLPAAGVHSVVLDGRGEPVAVLRTTRVDIEPLHAVDAAFAWDEGEGDRSLDYWLAAHRAFFARTSPGFTDDDLVVLERFALVWPVTAVTLRAVEPADLDTFYVQQLDVAANRMAAFTAADPADRAAFDTKWARILAPPRFPMRTIVVDGSVAGYVASWDDEGGREITYWIGAEFWGRGVATRALGAFLEQFGHRPLRARVATDNVGSLRVLERNGFVVVGTDSGFATARGTDVDEYVLRLT